MITFPFKVGAVEPFSAAMPTAAPAKSVSLDELRRTTRSLSEWRSGALARITRKQTERLLRREVRRWLKAADSKPINPR